MKILALLLQEMISISINAHFQILLIFSLYIMLLYTFSWIEVNKILLTPTNVLFENQKRSVKMFRCLEHLSRDIRFPTMWYVRPAMPQMSAV